MLAKARQYTQLLCAVIIVMACSNCISYAQNSRDIIEHQLFRDTTTAEYKIEKSNVFYDKIQNKHYKSWISRTLARLLVAGRSSGDDSTPSKELDISQDYFEQYSGLKIAAINIVQANVFEQTDRSNEKWVDRFVNSLHVLTSEKQLKQNLLFKVGDTIQPYSMAINEKLIRNLPYISTSFFVITRNSSDPKMVTVNIFARDSWTISADMSTGSSPWIEVYDRNFVGTGNQLALRYYAQYGMQKHGAEATYTFNNLLGTFADLGVSAGIGASNNKAKLNASRQFILPNDHIFGFAAGFEQRNKSMTSIDTTIPINRLDYALWYGYSFGVDTKRGTNLFITTGVDYTKFHKRPITSDSINPYYHNKTTLLVNFGIARQNFFQGNMIYGYGRTEDVPYGFKIDGTVGLRWSEFYGRRYYVGGSASWGNITKIGYISAMAGISTFLEEGGKKSQGQINAQLRYFTPLFRLGSFNIRQFMNVSSTWGFNRYLGEEEMLSYREFAEVRGVNTDIRDKGYNRFTMSAETVFFTPIFFYHFRFAFNLWGDVGWLGYKQAIFANQLSSAIGVGVRIKNERLIFNSISIRFGFSLKMPDYARYNPFQIISEQKLNLNGFEPTVPTIQQYY